MNHNPSYPQITSDLEIQSTLLIPSSLLKLYNIRIAEYSSFHEFLNSLLEAHTERLQTELQSTPRSISWRALYQRRHLNLSRKTVRLRRSTWRQLRDLSHATGFSCCLLFTILLEYEKYKKEGTTFRSKKSHYFFKIESFSILVNNPQDYKSGMRVWEKQSEGKWREWVRGLQNTG